MTDKKPNDSRKGPKIQKRFVKALKGRDRESAIRQLADQEGISYEEMQRELEPSDSEKERKVREIREVREAQEKRLQMVRDAFWEGSRTSDIKGLHTAMSMALGISDISEQQVRAAYNLLPSEIIGDLIKTGFLDTILRDDAYVFFCEHEFELRQSLGISPKN